MLEVSPRSAQEFGDEPGSHLWVGGALTAGKQHRQRQQDLHLPLTWAWEEKQGQAQQGSVASLTGAAVRSFL